MATHVSELLPALHKPENQIPRNTATYAPKVNMQLEKFLELRYLIYIIFNWQQAYSLMLLTTVKFTL